MSEQFVFCLKLVPKIMRSHGPPHALVVAADSEERARQIAAEYARDIKKPALVWMNEETSFVDPDSSGPFKSYAALGLTYEECVLCEGEN